MKIYKYPIHEVGSTIRIKLPKEASILSAQVQNGTLCIWATIVDNDPIEERTLRVITTGEEFDPTNLWYIGTFQLAGDNFIGHLYEVGD